MKEISGWKKWTVCAIFLMISVAQGDAVTDGRELKERTLPAYAVALHAAILNATGCHRELQLFRSAVDRRILWGLKMLDSSGEPKSGFIYGNNFWLGSRHQCQDVMNKSPFVLAPEEKLNNSKYRNEKEEFSPFDLNYFVAHFRHNSTLQYHVRLPNEDLLTLGLCLPNSCTEGELAFILNEMFRNRRLFVGDMYDADFKLIEVRDLRDDHQWLLNGRTILIGCALTSIFTLMVIGTAYDILIHQKRNRKIKKAVFGENNNVHVGLMSNGSSERSIVQKKQTSLFADILMCFSVYTNSKILFDTSLGNDSVPQVHGLRFLGMIWIVMIHTIFYMSDYADNKPWSWRMSEGFVVQVISNSTLSVDTFFFLSGFLVAYLYLKEHKKNDQQAKSFNYGRKVCEFVVAVLRRFIRLTPAYMMTMGIVQLNSTWYGETSPFYMTERPQEVCAKYWWRNILYINNLFGRDTMCMSWSWYLSNDMQFFIIGTFLLILSSVFFYAASAILLLLLVGSISITGYISYIYGYVPTMDEQYNLLDVLYDPPWTRIGPYIVGMVTAYIIIRLNNQFPLRRRTVITSWCLGICCNMFVLFGLWERHISVISAAFYVALSRTAWAIGLSWLLIACCTKHGGFVNKVLCLKAWIPLSRLTYCAYLLNPFVINSLYLHGETAVHVDYMMSIALFLGNLFITYICSYMLSLMLETPNILLMRMLIGSFDRKR